MRLETEGTALGMEPKPGWEQSEGIEVIPESGLEGGQLASASTDKVQATHCAGSVTGTEAF